MDGTRNDRRLDIDWLRIAATYLLIPFHVGMVFNPAPFFHIRNDEQSFAFVVFCGFISLWHMPLFFLLAGWSAFSSLSTRRSAGFLRERFFRLLVPLVAACIFLMPAIKYFELSTGLDANYTGLYVAPSLQDGFRQVIPSGLPVAAPFDESFLAFLPTFFTDLERFTWSHLWFVAYLITFTLLYLPLLRLMRDSRARFERGVPAWLVYAPILPLAIVQVTMRERWPGLQNLIDDWANFAYYSVYLLAGFALARWPAFEAAVHRERKRALALGVAASLVLLLGVAGVFASPALLLANTAIAGWCFVVALLGWAHQKLRGETPALGYLTESAFPVYLLHQAAIVVPGYFLIQLPVGLWTRFVLLLVVATAVTIGTYHFFVRPFAIPRFLCGMKARPRTLHRPVAVGAAGAALALLAAVAIGVSAASEPIQGDAASPIGLWYAEGGAAQVEVFDCDGGLCGRVTSLRSPFDESGCALRDGMNPEAENQHRPVLGLEILRVAKQPAGGAAQWNGTIYDPGTGRTYSCTVTPDGENRLRLRGYVGVPLLGRTTTWIRVGREEQMCRDSAAQAAPAPG